MSDFTKVVLHTPTYKTMHQLWVRGKVSKTETSLVFKLDRNFNSRLTLVAIQDREEIRVGVSICNTKVDNFNKKKGVENATVRALTSPIYIINSSGKTKKELLDLLKEQHTLVASNLKQYKRLINA